MKMNTKNTRIFWNLITYINSKFEKKKNWFAAADYDITYTHGGYYK